MVVSLNKGTPTKYSSSYYGDPQNGIPNCGKPLNKPQVSKESDLGPCASTQFAIAREFHVGSSPHMSYSLNSLKGGYIGDSIGDIKGDTRSLDSSSYNSFVAILSLLIFPFKPCTHQVAPHLMLPQTRLNPQPATSLCNPDTPSKGAEF